MKVLLLKNDKSLGKKGEIKEVKDGYAKNYLIPKRIAVIATKEALRMWEENQKILQEKEQKELEKLKNLKKSIESITLTIIHKVGANGSLFGSITNKEISQLLKEKYQIEIDKKNINLHPPIKQTGQFNIDIKLGYGLHAILKLNIEGK